MNELLNKILFINPDAKFSITDVSNRQNVDDGLSKLVERDGLLIVWNPLNDKNPPTQAALNKLDLAEVNTAAEQRRKDQRDASYADDPNIKIGLQVAKAANPSITLTQYLDNLGL